VIRVRDVTVIRVRDVTVIRVRVIRVRAVQARVCVSGGLTVEALRYSCRVSSFSDLPCLQLQ
jgi:hypothetical protein